MNDTKKIETLSFPLINEPLGQAVRCCLDNLEKMRQKIQKGNKNNLRDTKYPFFSVLKGILANSFDTYKAIIKLVKQDANKSTNECYPIQGYILERSLIDALFNLSAILEKPAENCFKYELARYRHLSEEYRMISERYANNTKWSDYLTGFADLLQKEEKELTKLYSINKEYFKDTANIKRWPIPSRILSGDWLVSEERKKNLKEVYDWEYGHPSEISHQTSEAVIRGWASTKPELMREEETRKYYEHMVGEVIGDSILFVLMILSEIEAFCDFSNNQKLRYIWTILNSHYDKASDYYNSRYEKLLRNKEK